MAKRVVILGGGVAGMSAAHELVERGFEVEIHEHQPKIPGGKARSIPVPGTGTDGRPDLPGEHGFRFFPPFYRNLPDTMARIPDPNTGNMVVDNLRDVNYVLLSVDNANDILVPTRFPRSLDDLKLIYQAVYEKLPDTLGLTIDEMEFYAERLWQFLTSCDARRNNEYANMTWWEYIDAADKSKGYQIFLAEGLTKSLVAASSKVGNAKVTGDTGVQLYLDASNPLRGPARSLDGPTNEKWIDPWLNYLVSKGAKYVFDSNVVKLAYDDKAHRITSATVEDGDGNQTEVTGDYFILAVPLEVAGKLFAPDIGPKDFDGVPEYKNVLKGDNSLADVVALSSNVAWMNGLMIYFDRPVRISSGYAIYVDANWALTSVDEGTLWPDVDLAHYGDGTVQGLLSIDISDWTAPGNFNGKAARDCTNQEIFEEVLAQIMSSVNEEGKPPIIDKDWVVTWFLDPDIHSGKVPDQPPYTDLEPLFIAAIDTWGLRPQAHTNIPNFFLASDYIQTDIKLATMEGANEAARMAVNALIRASGEDVPLAKVHHLNTTWVLSLWRWVDYWRFRMGLPWHKDFPKVIDFMQSLLISGNFGVRGILARLFKNKS